MKDKCYWNFVYKRWDYRDQIDDYIFDYITTDKHLAYIIHGNTEGSILMMKGYS